MKFLFLLIAIPLYGQDLLLLMDSGVDTIPSAFSFTDITGATLDSTYISNGIVPVGFDSAYATANTDSFRIGSLGTWQVDTVVVDKNDTIYVKKVSSNAELTTVSATLTISKTSDVFSITTKKVSDDTPPDAPTSINAINITRD